MRQARPTAGLFLCVPSIRHSLPSRVGDPDPRDLDHAPARPHPLGRDAREPLVDQFDHQRDREAMRHHESVGAPVLSGTGEHGKRALGQG